MINGDNSVESFDSPYITKDMDVSDVYKIIMKAASITGTDENIEK